MQIRIAAVDDLPRIVAIYNQAVLQGNCTADTDPLQVEERKEWFREHSPDHYPIFVMRDEKNQQISGWCSLTAHRRGRKALARVAEISYYVDQQQRGQGIGKRLIEHAIQEAPQHGLRNLFAILLDTTTISIGLLERYGFSQLGHLPDIAEFPDGTICGQFIYGRSV